MTLFRLLGDGAKLEAGGLISGGLYTILRWAFSGIGANILLVIGLLADIMTICRITPGAVWDALRPLDADYDEDEVDDGPIVLPNVHEARPAGGHYDHLPHHTGRGVGCTQTARC